MMTVPYEVYDFEDHHISVMTINENIYDLICVMFICFSLLALSQIVFVLLEVKFRLSPELRWPFPQEWR